MEEPVELGDVAAMHDGNAKAVWFARAGGAELAANVTASRSRLAIAFGTTPDRLLAEVLKRLGEPQPVTEVKQAPAQEVVERDPDLTALPVHLQHGYDGAPYISASMDFTRDAARDVTNVGIRRLMLRGRREAGVDLNAPSDLRAIYQMNFQNGVFAKPYPLTPDSTRDGTYDHSGVLRAGSGRHVRIIQPAGSTEVSFVLTNGTAATIPPVGSCRYRSRLPSNRWWQCARAEVHIRTKSCVTVYSGLAGPYGSTATSPAGRSTTYGEVPPWTPPKSKSGL